MPGGRSLLIADSGDIEFGTHSSPYVPLYAPPKSTGGRFAENFHLPRFYIQRMGVIWTIPCM